MSHDDFAFEPIRGLPELPPEGERILWQGAPNWWALARASMGLHWIAAYFVVLALWRMSFVAETRPLGAAAISALPFLVLGAGVIALFCLIAYVLARTTVYTITTRRVAMRIGAALTVTLNLPYRAIARAGLDLRRDGTGTIALELIGDTKLSYLVCWPHVRPWRMRHTEPALRCIPDAARVAALLAEAAECRMNTPEVARRAPISTVSVAAE